MDRQRELFFLLRVAVLGLFRLCARSCSAVLATIVARPGGLCLVVRLPSALGGVGVGCAADGPRQD